MTYKGYVVALEKRKVSDQLYIYGIHDDEENAIKDMSKRISDGQKVTVYGVTKWNEIVKLKPALVLERG